MKCAELLYDLSKIFSNIYCGKIELYKDNMQDCLISYYQSCLEKKLNPTNTYQDALIKAKKFVESCLKKRKYDFYRKYFRHIEKMDSIKEHYSLKADEDYTLKESVLSCLERIINETDLSELERIIIKEIFYNGRKQKDIANEQNQSKQKVSIEFKKLMSKLKEKFYSEYN